MGEVYLAEDVNLGRKVALKLMSGELASDSTARKRFEREARSLSELSHPGIASLLEFGWSDEVPFLALEFIDGETLQQRIAREPLPVNEVIDLGIAVSDALAHAHARGIIHRDVKSANIMLPLDGPPRLVDFGLSRREDGSRLTESGAVPGTVAYLSPEQITGSQADGRSEIWSLGVVLYEAVIGVLPFEGENALTVSYKILNEDPAEPSTIRRGIPAELQRIVLRCLAREPENRYQQIQEVAADLKHLKSRILSPSTRPTSENRVRGPHLPWAVALLGLLVGIAFLIILVVLPRNRAGTGQLDQPATLAILGFREPGAPGGSTTVIALLSLLEAGLTESPSLRVISPDLIAEVRRRRFGTAATGLEDPQSLQVARDAHASLLLAGQLLAEESGTSVVWRLVDVRDGHTIASKHVEGGNLQQMVDGVVAGVLPVVDSRAGAHASSTVPSVAQLTSSSATAYEHYARGMLALDSNGPEVALREFNAALAIDSTFALAYFGRSRTWWTDTPESLRISSVDSAWRLRDRLGVRDRLRVEAWRANLKGNFHGAIAAYESILARWPDDLGALRDISDILYYRWCYADADRYLERGLALYPNHAPFMQRRTMILIYRGKGAEAVASAEEECRQTPQNDDAWQNLIAAWLTAGRPDSAEAVINRLRALNPNFVPYPAHVSAIFYAQGDVIAAIATLEKACRSDRWNDSDKLSFFSYALEWPALTTLNAEIGRRKEMEKWSERAGSLGMIPASISWGQLFNEMWLGQSESVLRKCRSILDQNQDLSDNHENSLRLFEGLALVELDSLESARRVLVTLEQESRSVTCGTRSLTSQFRARLLLAEGKVEDAIREEQSFVESFNPAGLYNIQHHEFMAKAQARAGRYDEAEKELKFVLERYPAHALGRYRLARLYEEMGRRKEALDEYARFLKAWSRADPDLEQLRVAKKKLVELGSDI